MYAVIMAGGSGTRLWPMSREAKPKQLHKLISDKTLIQETYERVNKFVPEDRIYISAIPKFVDEIRKQLPNVSSANYIIEPSPKNTADAFAYIATKLLKRDPEAIIATIASDHLVKNNDVFIDTMKTAQKTVEKFPDHLVAVGINPSFPSTELGYMKLGQVKDKVDGKQIFEIDGFVEKPDIKTAQQYVQSWEYLWNGAYYFFKAKELLKWTKKYRPNIAKTIEKIDEISQKDEGMITEAKIAKEYDSLDKEQFEYAVVENEDFNKMLAIPADLGWSDIGTWGTLCDVLLNSYSTHLISRGNHIDYDSKDSLVYSNDKMIATIGLKDVIVVETDDVIFVADKTRSNELKKLLDKLKSEGKHLYL